MRDLFGALCAIILDLKWLLVGIFFGALAMYSCAAHAGDKDEVLMQIWHGEHNETHVIILKAQGKCPAGQHKTYGHDVDQFDTGCAKVDEKTGEVTIEWDDGGTFWLPPKALHEWRPGPLLGPNPLDNLKI